MDHTLFYDDHEKIVPNRAYSYYHEDEVLKKGVMNFANAGATSLFTTAEDLVVWANHLNNPPDDEVEAIVTQMNTLAVLNNGETFGGAYGQFITPYKGLNQIQHGGADAGYRSYLARFPDQDFAVSVVSNYANSGPNGLALQVADIFLKDDIAVAANGSGSVPEEGGASSSSSNATEETAPQEEASIISLEEEALKAFEGYYWMEDLNTYRHIFLKDGELVYSRPGGNDNRLAPISDTEFKMLDVGIYAVVAFTEENGKRIMTYKDPNGENTVMPAFDYKALDASALSAMTGTYYSSELNISVELVDKEGELVVRHPRHPDLDLIYLRDTSFSTGWASIEFFKDSGGSVNGMELTTGRTRNLKFTKED